MTTTGVVWCARVVVDRWKAGGAAAVSADAFVDALVELEHALDALDHPDEGG